MATVGPSTAVMMVNATVNSILMTGSRGGGGGETVLDFIMSGCPKFFDAIPHCGALTRDYKRAAGEKKNTTVGPAGYQARIARAKRSRV